MIGFTSLIAASRPYAEALFFSFGKQELDEWLELLDSAANIINNKEVQLVLFNPKLTNKNRLDLISSLISLKKSVSKKNLTEFCFFLKILISNKRLNCISQILQQLEKLRNTSNGFSEANITSTFDLSNEQKNDLVKIIELKLNKKIKAKFHVNKNLIGGFKILIKDFLIDMSVRAQLSNLKNILFRI